MIMGRNGRYLPKSAHDHETVGPVHEVLRALAARARAGSQPLVRDDGLRIALAGVSVDYYIRLEQGRGPRPSRQVLSALARALILTADERDYLFRVAGESPPPVAGPSREITPGLRHATAEAFRQLAASAPLPA
jgi:Helix-turn-helix domain